MLISNWLYINGSPITISNINQYQIGYPLVFDINNYDITKMKSIQMVVLDQCWPVIDHWV